MTASRAPEGGDRLDALWEGLSEDERRRLRERLLRRSAAGLWRDDGCLDGRELLAAEAWFADRVESARGPRERLSRRRLWLALILLRHAGLRWLELAALEAGDFDWAIPALRVTGRRAREIPLAPAVARRIRAALEEPGGSALLPVDYDASHVRRTLQICAREIGLPDGLLTVRGLRRSRGLELRRQGLPDLVVDAFLGRPRHGGDIIRHDPAGVARALRARILQGPPQTSSARNRIQGRIRRVTPFGMLVIVEIRSLDGPAVASVITETSRRRLRLAEGALADAVIKAPHVEIFPAEGDLPPAAGMGAASGVPQNVWEGVVISARMDCAAAEIVVRLAGGADICAVRHFSEDPGCIRLCAPGAPARVRVSASAVILGPAS